MRMYDRETYPKRPWNVGGSGSLVVWRYGGQRKMTPRLVIEAKAFWGNPNGDNTADHWHWQYLLLDGKGKPHWSFAKKWKVFSA